LAEKADSQDTNCGHVGRRRQHFLRLQKIYKAMEGRKEVKGWCIDDSCISAGMRNV
jgi:hypothetical protein